MTYNKERLDILISAVKETGFVIGNCYSVMNQITDENVKSHYAKQLLPIVADYKEYCNELKVELETYFEIEDNEGGVINFGLRKLYKDLTESVNR